MTREDIIRMALETGCWETDTGELVTDEIQLGRFAALVASAEREACAKVCENIYEGDEACGDWPTPEMCANAIRARGQA